MTRRDYSVHLASGDESPLQRLALGLTGVHQGQRLSQGYPFNKKHRRPAPDSLTCQDPSYLSPFYSCSRGRSKPPRRGSHLVLGQVTKLLSVLGLSMPGPPSPNVWGDQEDRPCPWVPWSPILVRQVWRGLGVSGLGMA